MNNSTFQVNTNFADAGQKLSASGWVGDSYTPVQGKMVTVFAPNFPVLLRRIKKVTGLSLDQISLTFQPE